MIFVTVRTHEQLFERLIFDSFIYMTGKMVYPITDKFIVEWEEMKKVYPKAINLGNIF